MYAKIINNEVVKFPYFIQELKTENPYTSFADNLEVDFDTLAEFNVYRVFETAHPEFNSLTEKVVKGAIVLVNDRWEESWDVVALTDNEIAVLTNAKADKVRAERNRLLVECDWTQYKDISDEVSALWAPYRQQLRDITLQDGFPFNVEFPVKPA